MPSTRFIQVFPLGFRVEHTLAANDVDDTGSAVWARRYSMIRGEGLFGASSRDVAPDQFRDVFGHEFRSPHGTPGLFTCRSVLEIG